MNNVNDVYLGYSYREVLQNRTSRFLQPESGLPENEKNDADLKPAEENRLSEDAVKKNETDPKKHGSQSELSDSEKRELEKLKATDRKVRQHEMAHLAAAGGISVSGANFEYKRGPDGVMYAVGGEVRIDTSSVEGDPQATIQKAEKIRSAALAPADPSPQDRSVAAKASQMAMKARMELMKQNMEEASTDDVETEGKISGEVPAGADGVISESTPGSESRKAESGLLPLKARQGLSQYRNAQKQADHGHQFESLIDISA